MTKLTTASIYETAKAIAWATYVGKIMADTIKRGMVSFSALAQAMKKVKEEQNGQNGTLF